MRIMIPLALWLASTASWGRKPDPGPYGQPGVYCVRFVPEGERDWSPFANGWHCKALHVAPAGASRLWSLQVAVVTKARFESVSLARLIDPIHVAGGELFLDPWLITKTRAALAGRGLGLSSYDRRYEFIFDLELMGSRGQVERARFALSTEERRRLLPMTGPWESFKDRALKACVRWLRGPNAS